MTINLASLDVDYIGSMEVAGMASGYGKFQTTCPRCGMEGRRQEGLCGPCMDSQSGRQQPIQGEHFPSRYSARKPLGVGSEAPNLDR